MVGIIFVDMFTYHICVVCLLLIANICEHSVINNFQIIMFCIASCMLLICLYCVCFCKLILFSIILTHQCIFRIFNPNNIFNIRDWIKNSLWLSMDSASVISVNYTANLSNLSWNGMAMDCRMTFVDTLCVSGGKQLLSVVAYNRNAVAVLHCTFQFLHSPFYLS